MQHPILNSRLRLFSDPKSFVTTNSASSCVTSRTDYIGLLALLSAPLSSEDVGDGTKVLLLISEAISGCLIELCLNFRNVTIGKK